MAQRIETANDAMAFVAAGDAQMEPDWFWERLDCNAEAIAELAAVCAHTLPHDGAFALTCMEIGARLALRLSSEELSLGKEEPA